MLQECAEEADIEFAKKVESLSPTDPKWGGRDTCKMRPVSN